MVGTARVHPPIHETELQSVDWMDPCIHFLLHTLPLTSLTCQSTKEACHLVVLLVAAAVRTPPCCPPLAVDENVRRRHPAGPALHHCNPSPLTALVWTEVTVP